MIAAWIWYLIVAVVGTVTAFFLTPFSRPAKNWVRKKVRKLGRRTLHESRRAIKAWRKQRVGTARGRLRAKRRQQPMRLTYGHRRTEDDPTLSRRAARKARDKAVPVLKTAIDKARLAWLNRDEAPSPSSTGRRGPFAVGTRDNPSSRDGTGGYKCGAPRKTRPGPCEQPVSRPGARCPHHRKLLGVI